MFCKIRKYICKGRVYQQCANALSLGLALALCSKPCHAPNVQWIHFKCNICIVRYIKHYILYIRQKGLALASRLQTLPRAHCVLCIVYIKHCILYISNIIYCIFQTLYIAYIMHYMLYARQNRLPLALHSNLTTRPNICTLHCLSISCIVYCVICFV